MSKPTFELERSHDVSVIGVDEAGRGPWAGPVVVAGAMFKTYDNLPHWVGQLNDSKKLSAAKRAYLYQCILESSDILTVHIATIDVPTIDRLNILEATMEGMRECIRMLRHGNQVVFVDGNRSPIKENWCQPVVKGDSKSLSIAAASVVAKVHRDQLMAALADVYPHYGWDRNAGYGAAGHQAALKEFGITEHHRKSFAPIKALGV